MKEYFEFLETLRSSGVTNMFGAAPYIKIKFQDLSLDECNLVLNKWMDNYEKLTKI